jgi:molecular chaperone HscA
LKVDATLLSEQQLTALNVAKDHLYVQLNANDIQAIEQAVNA